MDSAEEMIPYVSPSVGDAGSCDDDEVFQAINEARRLLWNKTNTEPTTHYFCVRCPDKCVVLPNEDKQIILAWLGDQPAFLGNEWFQSIPQVGVLDSDSSCHKMLVEVGGRHATFTNYENEYYIALVAESLLDKGKEITIFGNNKYQSHKKDQITLKAAPAYSKGKILFTSVINVIKPTTEGRIRLYAYDPNTQEYFLLAIYQPTDINPSFRKFKMTGRCTKSMTILAKKKYFPLLSKEEPVEFSVDAMIPAIQALNDRRLRRDAEFLQHLGIAVQEINRETADMEQIVASPMRFFSPHTVRNLLP